MATSRTNPTCEFTPFFHLRGSSYTPIRVHTLSRTCSRNKLLSGFHDRASFSAFMYNDLTLLTCSAVAEALILRDAPSLSLLSPSPSPPSPSPSPSPSRFFFRELRYKNMYIFFTDMFIIFLFIKFMIHTFFPYLERHTKYRLYCIISVNKIYTSIRFLSGIFPCLVEAVWCGRHRQEQSKTLSHERRGARVGRAGAPVVTTHTD